MNRLKNQAGCAVLIVFGAACLCAGATLAAYAYIQCAVGDFLYKMG